MPSLRIGIAGWTYPDWRDIVHSGSQASSRALLRRLADWFDLAEINASFYRTPTPETARSWVESIADRPAFEFSAKLHRSFTHGSIGTLDAEEAGAVHRFLHPLAESGRLGALVIQFPFRFHATAENWAHARAVFSEFRAYPLVMEVRHASWWKPRFFQYLEEAGVAVCSIDQPELPNNVPNEARHTAHQVYVRFHGRNAAQWWTAEEGIDRYNYLYDADTIRRWADDLRRLLGQGKDIRALFNNHVRGQAVANALMLSQCLGVLRGAPTPELVRRYGSALRAAGVPSAPADAPAPPGEAGDLFA